MPDFYQRQLRERLEQLPYSPMPFPWRAIGGSGIGGLTEVGFADGTDDLLVVSSQGRGLFDCLSGERIARDCEAMFANSDSSGLTAPGIGKHQSIIFRLAGLEGGGLATCTQDGWVVHVIQLPWPIHVVFITRDYQDVSDTTGHITKLCNDEPCSFRAAGFSPTGRSFVFATSCQLMIYGREEV
jgi:hypothetical protein